MSKETVAKHLIDKTFNSIIQSYGSDKSAATKKMVLINRLQRIVGTSDQPKGLPQMLEELTQTLSNDEGFAVIIDAQRSIIFKTKTTNTRTKLEALNSSLIALNTYNGGLSPNVYVSIWDTFETCINKTSDDGKKESLQNKRAQILTQIDDNKARETLKNGLAFGDFKRAIEAKTGAGRLSSSPSNTKQMLDALLAWLDRGAPVMDPTELSSWMSEYVDTIKLGDIASPGSHDAGVYNDPLDPGNRPHARNQPNLPAGICQSLSIYNQAMVGVRYFDVRFDRYRDGEYRATHDTEFLRVKYGVWGATSSKILGDIKKFLTEHNQEVIYLKITHTKDPVLIRHILSTLGNLVYDGALLRQNNICLTQVPLGDVRGKVIILVEKKLLAKESVTKEFTLMESTPSQLHEFKNIKGDPETPPLKIKQPKSGDGLVIWGGNTSSKLPSAIGWTSINEENLVHGQLGKATMHYKNRGKNGLNNVFFQMSWTLMMGDVVQKSGRAHELLDHALQYMTGQKVNESVFANIPDGDVFKAQDRHLGYPNFLHLDNSNEECSKKIIKSLNQHLEKKQLQAPQNVEVFQPPVEE